MKKIVLTLAVAFAATSAFAQATADDGQIRTSDHVQINGSLTMLDMIDLVPENQTASNTVGTWAAYNNGVQLNELGFPAPNPPNNNNPANDIEFRVSATRPFSVTIQNTTWNRSGVNAPGNPVPAPSGVLPTFPASAFNCTGLASPEMVGMTGPYNINGKWSSTGFGGAAMNNVSSTVNFTGAAQQLFTADGCYNRQFDVRVAIRPGYAYNHQGTYTGTIHLVAALN